MHPLLKLLKGQGTVVKGAGQAEAIAHQRFLSRSIAVVHGMDLRQRHMTLVDEEEKIIRKIVDQRHGGRAHRTIGQHTGVVLNTAAMSQLPQHFDIVHGALLQPLGFHQHIVFFKIFQPLLQFPFDGGDRLLHLLGGGDIVACGINGNVAHGAQHLPRDGVELTDAVDLIAKKFHADGSTLGISRENLHRVATDTELIALKGEVVAVITDIHQAAQQLIPLILLSHAQGNDHVGIVHRVAQTVDAGNRCHHDDILAFIEGGRCAVAQAVDLLIGGGILFDKGIRMGNIGFWLIVVVIGDEVFHGVIREKLLELTAKLGGKGFVVCQHQRRALHLFNHLRHGIGLAAAGHTQQHLLIQTVFHTLTQRRNGGRLVAGGLKGGNNTKFCHFDPFFAARRIIPAADRSAAGIQSHRPQQ